MPKTKRRSAKKGSPHPVDVQVGERVRRRRTQLGMSQEKLGKALSLSFQQLQKYEKGTNRISANRLYEISRVLEVPVSYFFDETELEKALGGKEPLPPHSRETLRLVSAYYGIPDANIRRRLRDLLKSLARPGGG